MKIIENIKLQNNLNPNKHVAMYYKTEPFYTDINRYVHTNNWEIYKAVEILASLGYSIDLIDRSNHDWKPSKEYDLFLGLGVGNTGRLFSEYSRRSKAKKSVLLSMGPQPDISNKLVLERYSDFEKRTGHYAKPMRLVDMVIGDKFKEIESHADFVFNIGEKDNNSFKSLKNYGSGMKVLNFFPGISPRVKFENSWLSSRKRNNFLCFAGNGFICKGVDILVESFLKNENNNLHICGPSSEKSFFDYYGEKIQNSKNIFYHGFIEPGAEKFNELSALCAYVIFNSAAEGCCTSVATAMKSGLVPVINPWTGINIDSSVGISINEDGNKIENTMIAIEKAINVNVEDYKELTINTLNKSTLFSQASFEKSYLSCIQKVITSEEAK